MTLKESLLPSSEKEVGILDKALREINEKNYISNEDFLKLCDEDVLLSKRLWNCLIETEAARISKYRPEILNGTEYALKYLETDYFKRAYEEEVIKRNRDTLELEKLKADVKNARWHGWLAITALLLSGISIALQFLISR